MEANEETEQARRLLEEVLEGAHVEQAPTERPFKIKSVGNLFTGKVVIKRLIQNFG